MPAIVDHLRSIGVSRLLVKHTRLSPILLARVPSPPTSTSIGFAPACVCALPGMPSPCLTHSGLPAAPNADGVFPSFLRIIHAPRLALRCLHGSAAWIRSTGGTRGPAESAVLVIHSGIHTTSMQPLARSTASASAVVLRCSTKSFGIRSHQLT